MIALLLLICVDHWNQVLFSALRQGTRHLRNWALHSKMIVTCFIKINENRALCVATAFTYLHYYWRHLWSRNPKICKYGISSLDQEGVLGLCSWYYKVWHWGWSLNILSSHIHSVCFVARWDFEWQHILLIQITLFMHLSFLGANRQ